MVTGSVGGIIQLEAELAIGVGAFDQRAELAREAHLGQGDREASFGEIVRGEHQALGDRLVERDRANQRIRKRIWDSIQFEQAGNLRLTAAAPESVKRYRSASGPNSRRKSPT